MPIKKTFILLNINPTTIDQNNQFSKKSNINSPYKFNSQITHLDAIPTNSTDNFFSYLDESKKNHKCIVPMYNLLGKPLPTSTNIHCFWCKHSFNSIPLGCPISYDVNSKSYSTDGIFCSFNCCIAFINDNSHIYKYNNSIHLLQTIYKQIFDNFIKITPASSWRLLETFGGTQTIETFRSNFNKISYIDIDIHINTLPKLLPIGHLFTEQIKF